MLYIIYRIILLYINYYYIYLYICYICTHARTRVSLFFSQESGVLPIFLGN